MKKLFVIILVAMIFMAKTAVAQNNNSNNVVMRVIENKYNDDSTILFRTWYGEYQYNTEGVWGEKISERQSVTVKTKTILIQKNFVLANEEEWVLLKNENPLVGVEYAPKKGLMIIFSQEVLILPNAKNLFIYKK